VGLNSIGKGGTRREVSGMIQEIQTYKKKQWENGAVVEAVYTDKRYAVKSGKA